jgi:hypothetical protein
MKRLILIAILMLLCAGGAVSQGRREFLSPDEINSIQDEQDHGKRVLLYLQFAQRRLDAVRGKLASGEANAGRDVQQYLSEYNSILDALTDSLNGARTQRSAMGKPIKELESRASGFLRYLQSLESSAAANRSDYQFTLEEAIDTTKDELAEAKKGAFPEVNERKPPSDLPSAPPPRSKSDADKSGAGKSNSEEGPPRKKSRSSSQSQ